MSSEFDTMSAMEMRRRIAAKEISPVDVTRRALAKAEATQSTLNAFYILMPEQALAAAKVAEDAVMKGAPLGTIHGIPFSTKDLIAVKGIGYASGSRTMARGMNGSGAVIRRHTNSTHSSAETPTKPRIGPESQP